MERQIITTSDGSKTIHIVEWNEHYHSVHGAIQEANHVYINQGLLFYFEQYPNCKSISILEIGFGTGLNTFLSLIEAKKNKFDINYTAVEAFPISEEELKALNYDSQLSHLTDVSFTKLHHVAWEDQHTITSSFSLTKQQKYFEDIDDKACFDLIYYDAFGARVQPELWTETLFQKMFDALRPKGVLVTYSAKGSVRRAMQAVGFRVERLPGPPGKREMLRMIKD